jgi:hypothetical protein
VRFRPARRWHSIKRDTSVNRPGRLFVLVGRKTFSAGIGLVEGIIDHTSAVLVGEPAGAPLDVGGVKPVVAAQVARLIERNGRQVAIRRPRTRPHSGDGVRERAQVAKAFVHRGRPTDLPVLRDHVYG